MNNFTRAELNDLSLGILLRAVPLMNIKDGYGMSRQKLALSVFVQQEKYPEAVATMRERLAEIAVRHEGGIRLEVTPGVFIDPAKPRGEKRTRSKKHGAVVQVHAICKRMDGKPAKEIIAECLAHGINKNTAKTQYYAYLKSKVKAN
jgi:hypothetical protein